MDTKTMNLLDSTGFWLGSAAGVGALRVVGGWPLFTIWPEDVFIVKLGTGPVAGGSWS